MNYRGVDIYTRNGATRRFANHHSVADLGVTASFDCPFCGEPTTSRNGIMAEHLEHGGFTRCPAVGTSIAEVQRIAERLRPDYKLPNECRLPLEGLHD